MSASPKFGVPKKQVLDFVLVPIYASEKFLVKILSTLFWKFWMVTCCESIARKIIGAAVL